MLVYLHMPLIVWFFILSAALFAMTHAFATVTSLYWYYPWFDMVMHFWGGLLLVLGVHAISRLPIPIKPTRRTIVVIAFAGMIAWEVFERMVGLYSADTYFIDTLKDIALGTTGVLVGYYLLKKKKHTL